MLEHKSILSVEEVGMIAEEFGINHRAIGAAARGESKSASQGLGGGVLRLFQGGILYPGVEFSVGGVKILQNTFITIDTKCGVIYNRIRGTVSESR